MSLSSIAVAAALAGAAVALAVPAVPRRQLRTSAPESLATVAAPEGLRRHRVVLSSAAGVGATLVVGGEVGVVVGVLAALTAWRVLTRTEPAGDRRRRERLVAGLPHVVDLMAASLSVGAAPATAVDQAARVVDPPMREELLMVTSRLGLGVDPVRVWTDVGRHPQLGALGRCLARALDSGAPVGEAMQRLGNDLRRNARADVESHARAVGVKAAAPLGLCLLPAFVLVGIVPLVVASVDSVLHL